MAGLIVRPKDNAIYTFKSELKVYPHKTNTLKFRKANKPMKFFLSNYKGNYKLVAPGVLCKWQT